MAELLVKAVDSKHPDPEKDARASYKAGDVVGVRDDGWPWGTLELLPPADGGLFNVIRVSDATSEQLQAWTKDNWGVAIDGVDKVNGRRRAVKVDTTTAPAPFRLALNQTGEVTTTWDTFSPNMINKVTLETAEGGVLPE